eukprot:m.140356 g.140356  ORF g.140356 m.140356 type:complete len:551 (+) comp38299_c0_seq3:314-1966(+)
MTEEDSQKTASPAVELLDDIGLEEPDKVLLLEPDDIEEADNETDDKAKQSVHPQLWIHSLFRMRVITLSLFAGFFSLGVVLSLLGPTLLDLACNTHSSLKTLSYIFTARSTGYLSGSILGGILFDRFEGHLLVSISQILCTVGTFLVPLLKLIGPLAVCVVFQGVAMGFLDTGGNVMLLQLWGPKSAPYLQALHFAFGAGAFISPLLAEPFLVNTDNANSSTHHQHFESCPSVGTNDSSMANVTESCGADYKPVFGMSYYITASLMFVTIVGFLYYAIQLNVCHGGSSRRPKSVRDWKQQFVAKYVPEKVNEDEITDENGSEKCSSADTQKYANTSKSYVYQILALLFFFYFFYIGIEVTYGGFVASYAVCYLNMSKPTAAILTSVYWGTFALGRGLGILFAALKVSPVTMVMMDFFGCLAAVTFLVVFSSSVVCLWCGTALLGISIASIFPTAISWAETYIEITGKRASVFTVGASFGEMVLPLMAGKLFVSYGPIYFLYSTMGSSVAASVVFVAIWFRAKPSRCICLRCKGYSGKFEVSEGIELQPAE